MSCGQKYFADKEAEEEAEREKSRRPTMGEYFQGIKVGDRVWSVVYGWGEVIFVTPEWFNSVVGSPEFVVSADCGGKMKDTPFQTLFWDEVTITPPPKPKRMVRRELQCWFDGDTSAPCIILSHTRVDTIKDFPHKATLTWEEEE